jgi:Tfp pilus assembly protein PilP
VPPPKPAEPVTPPLPFTFVGMLERGTTKPEAFLAKGDALLVVSVGDLLDNNTYRVDTVTANEVVMTYLPMNIQQTLVVPGGTK